MSSGPHVINGSEVDIRLSRELDDVVMNDCGMNIPDISMNK